jgi:hypothetical protein
VDFNQLYFDHQLLLIKAQQTDSSVRRHALRLKASDVAARVWRSQRYLGAAAAPYWQGLAGAL